MVLNLIGGEIVRTLVFFGANYPAVSGEGVDQKGYSWFPIPEEGFGPGPGEFE